MHGRAIEPNTIAQFLGIMSRFLDWGHLCWMCRRAQTLRGVEQYPGLAG